MKVLIVSAENSAKNAGCISPFNRNTYFVSKKNAPALLLPVEDIKSNNNNNENSLLYTSESVSAVPCWT